jgi:hypothetical protein
MSDDLGRLSATERAKEEEFRARIKAVIPFGWVTVRGAVAFDEWSRLKTAGRGYPIVVGNDKDLELLAEGYEIVEADEDFDPQRVLNAAAGLAIPADLPDWSENNDSAKEEEWPGDVGPSPELTNATNISTGEPHDRVHILLVPAKASWEVPAYLRWGGWNSCPLPAAHVAALRLWHERYGMELVGLSNDTMNLLGARSPATREEALELAQAQYRYCPDIVDQGVETVPALAASLMTSKWWYFWWD